MTAWEMTAAQLIIACYIILLPGQIISTGGEKTCHYRLRLI